MRKNKGILLLIAIVLLVWGGIYFSTDLFNDDLNQNLFEINNVSEVKIQRFSQLDQNIKLVKKDHWQITEPIENRAQDDQAEQLLIDLQDVLKSNNQVLVSNEVDFNRPAAVLHLKYPNQTESLFDVSYENNFQGKFYLRDRQQQKIYLADGELKKVLLQDAILFENRQVILLPQSEMISFSFKAKNSVLSFTKDKSQLWISPDHKFDLDQIVVKSFFNDIFQWRFLDRRVPVQLASSLKIGQLILKSQNETERWDFYSDKSDVILAVKGNLVLSLSKKDFKDLEESHINKFRDRYSPLRFNIEKLKSVVILQNKDLVRITDFKSETNLKLITFLHNLSIAYFPKASVGLKFKKLISVEISSENKQLSIDFGTSEVLDKKALRWIKVNNQIYGIDELDYQNLNLEQFLKLKD